MIKDLWFKAEEIVSKVDVADFVVNVGWFILFVFKTIIMFIACVGVFAVLLITNFLKGRKRIIYNRDSTKEYLVRYYLFLKDRKRFPFNITLHKIMMSDEPVLHNHPWNWGALIIKGGYWEHSLKGKTWRGPGSLRFRKAEDLHYLELAKDKDGNEIPCWSLFYMGKKSDSWGFYVDGEIIDNEKYLSDRKK
jgi:hypothetical protein